MESKRNIPFMETVSAQPILCEMNLSPKMLGQWTMGPPLKYAFHMNAQKFADYLRDFSVERGVTHILANMKNAKVDNGHIKYVKLDNERLVEGDIFIDCTGFKSLLMEKSLEVPFDDYSQWLLCDQAIIAAFDYEDYFPGYVRPYTTATALSSGWVWDTPLQSRRSIGYVHSSSFTTEEKAKRELLDYQDPKLKDVDTRIIKFKSGQRRKAWSGNCISIGLSGGFIEPLESTGLYFCDLAAVMLAEHFPYRDEDMPQLAYRFNRIISNRYYEVLDFINMHYCLSKRTDTEFWKEVQKPEHITDRLLAKFEHWKIKSPSMADFDDQAFMGFNYNVVADDDMDPRPPVDTAGLWNHESYEAILFGMGWREDEFSDSSKPSRVFPFVMDRLKQAPSKIPPHHIWLHHALGMKPWTGNKVPAGWV
jgi:tryptophan halogenase